MASTTPTDRLNALATNLVNQKFGNENIEPAVKKEMVADVISRMERYVMDRVSAQLPDKDAQELKRLVSSFNREAMWRFAEGHIPSFHPFLITQMSNFERVYLTR